MGDREGLVAMPESKRERDINWKYLAIGATVAGVVILGTVVLGGDIVREFFGQLDINLLPDCFQVIGPFSGEPLGGITCP